MNKEEIVDALSESYESRASDERLDFDIDTCLFDQFLKNTKHLLMLDYLYPSFSRDDLVSLLNIIERELRDILVTFHAEDIDNKLDTFMSSLPDIRNKLLSTADALLEGDPASQSIQEIILCYPGFYAISNYRIGHLFYQLGLKFLARLVTEDAHSATGVDINAGAEIGDRFFIDHGTGIVIGETCVIGDRVKLYQGVTLGALSLNKGRCLQGQKRHPTIEDNCTIYSSAAIFGGETVIGEGSTIGANTYILHSIPKHSRVYMSRDELIIVPKDKPRE